MVLVRCKELWTEAVMCCRRFAAEAFLFAFDLRVGTRSYVLSPLRGCHVAFVTLRYVRHIGAVTLG